VIVWLIENVSILKRLRLNLKMWSRIRNEDTGGVEYIFDGDYNIRIYRKETKWIGQYTLNHSITGKTVKDLKKVIPWIIKQKEISNEKT
tara:strand:+ start:37 stop:303 length:267 start_codon:yes stop_codon:yes gene_type:complete